MTTLNNGVAMPQVGFGVFQVPPAETAQAVGRALEAGYRSIDTARAYGNEKGVGEALAASGLPRDEVFVTTKLWNTDQGYDATLAAFDASMKDLGLERLDLYLIHWPVPAKNLYAESWKAMQKLYTDGRVRAIGVSNFQVAHLTRLIDDGGIVPAVNQIELHPALPQAELREFHADHGIATEAWSPLAQGAVLRNPVIVAIAEKYGKTAAQVVLRWHLDLGNIVIPKSVTPSRIRENIDISDFALTEGDLAEIARLDSGTRTGPDPDTFGG
ncbi:aldo/keto reductase [Streptosporangium lutulentum]|uniref:Diketogulonate reductase-like aldo/keto reductase n=1 Tax=Streptosporangium lutulentum TaxID=1461250 RepID=A0ABT9QS69_9ACTN|nr:aldo/keto reductase [Streptosporangium lutulentum]MDP9849584.1 diketogulonate reductase-like aldo/keto reductase [Streptosporangium lutulentum]